MKLELRDLSAGYNGGLVLDNIHFDIPEGGILTILGANGSGKSTLLKLIGRIIRPVSGAVLLDGKAVHSLDTRSLAKRMAILTQMHHLPGEITVSELVAYGRFPHRSGISLSASGDKDIIESAIRSMKLDELRSRKLTTLSGGELQRAWIAMALAQEPEILLLDEPTTYLDISCQIEIIDMIKQMNKRLGITILMVLHDLNLAVRCSDLMIALKNRQIRVSGTPEDIMRPEILEDIYGIRTEIIRSKEGLPFCIPLGNSGS